MSVRVQLQMPLHPYGTFTDRHKSAEKGIEETLKGEWSESTGVLECPLSTDKEKNRKTPFGVNFMRSQVLYRAAQGPLACMYKIIDKIIYKMIFKIKIVGCRLRRPLL